jgi:hypothetical protein
MKNEVRDAKNAKYPFMNPNIITLTTPKEEGRTSSKKKPYNSYVIDVMLNITASKLLTPNGLTNL